MLHTSMQWRFLPRSFPPESMVHEYLQRCCQRNRFGRPLAAVVRNVLAYGELQIDQDSIDAKCASAKGKRRLEYPLTDS